MKEFVMIERTALAEYLNLLLNVNQFKDYGPNGLQVEGKKEIRHIVYGVTASLALIEKAIEENADAIIVHHGLFWRGQDGCVVGWMKQRLQKLLAHDINLFGYHLPLDAHATLGNNATLGQALELKVDELIGDQGILAIGRPMDEVTITLDELVNRAEKALSRKVTVVEGDGRTLRKIGWCTGGAQGYFEEAIAAGVDAYITGEISEPQAHYAREMGVAYIAGGHHATERFGIQALAQEVHKKFGIEGRYIEVENPA